MRIQYGPASCILSPSGYVSSVKVEKSSRGLGWGSRLMQFICVLADAQSLRLKLDVAPYDDPRFSIEQTLKFYKRWGFKLDKSMGVDYFRGRLRPVALYRPPVLLLTKR